MDWHPRQINIVAVVGRLFWRVLRDALGAELRPIWSRVDVGDLTRYVMAACRHYGR